jgi:hypothetical protein
LSPEAGAVVNVDGDAVAIIDVKNATEGLRKAELWGAFGFASPLLYRTMNWEGTAWL